MKLKRPKSGQSYLLFLLWKRFGGPRAVSKLLGVPWYAPGNWNRDGQVPAKYVMLVAAKLGIPAWGLNYRAAKTMLLEDKIPSWKEVVEMYNLDKALQAEVIKLGEP